VFVGIGGTSAGVLFADLEPSGSIFVGVLRNAGAQQKDDPGGDQTGPSILNLGGIEESLHLNGTQLVQVTNASVSTGCLTGILWVEKG
jgi:hypothetical protein